jgi:trk system potassium uptake protein TrkH
MDVLFEVVSAIGTVGLSRGITGKLGAFSKTILIMVMFIGRLGPLTIVSSLSSEKQNPFLHCVEERVIIG